MTHAKDIGIAIRDGLDLLDDIERRDWDAEDSPVVGRQVIAVTDASDAASLIVVIQDGSMFRIKIEVIFT